MTLEEFEKIVEEGIRAIPKRFLEKLKNVDICIEEESTPFQLKKLRAKKNSLVLGLYEGIPQTERRHYAQVLPDKITIFKKSIEKVACSRHGQGLPEAAKEEIKEIVKNTVWHEIAHHFGMDEKRVREIEKKRRKR